MTGDLKSPVGTATSSPPRKSHSPHPTRSKSSLLPPLRRRSGCWSAVHPATGKADRQIARDRGKLSGLRIDFDNPFGADLGNDQSRAPRGEGDVQGILVLTDDRARILVIVLARLKLREDIDEFANTTGRQRFAGVQQRLVVDKPGPSLRQFVCRRAGSNDF